MFVVIFLIFLLFVLRFEADLAASLRRIIAYTALVDAANRLRAIPYDSQNADHEAMLMRVCISPLFSFFRFSMFDFLLPLVLYYGTPLAALEFAEAGTPSFRARHAAVGGDRLPGPRSRHRLPRDGSPRAHTAPVLISLMS